MTNNKLWLIHKGDFPVFATALHSGHDLRGELSQRIALDEKTRLREEDPFTDELAEVTENYIIPFRSRFEVDLNRARNEAVYVNPDDAWGLRVWKRPLNDAMLQRSLAEYDAFYREVEKLLTELERKYTRFVVLDIHSYNHRRGGPRTPPADPHQNPEVNVGTGTMERQRWGSLVDRFIQDLRQFNYLGRHLDVRENVKFVGRQFPHWVHSHFPESACVLAIEFKKFFMDEWSGEANLRQLQAIRDALNYTLPGMVSILREL